MKKRKPRSDKGKQRGSYKTQPEASQSNSKTLTDGSEVIIPVEDKLNKETLKSKDLTFEDLPEKLRMEIEGSIAYRVSLGLPDDSETRKANAVKYFIWKKEREAK
jgi:hypothetical protein